MINEYYENVRKEIAIEFGLEAGGYAPVSRRVISLAQCQYLYNKYAFDKALLIAKRYNKLAEVCK